MMCYKDMTFCMDAEHCANKTNCYRYFSPEEEQKANAWMENPPVAFSNYADECPKYVPDYPL